MGANLRNIFAMLPLLLFGVARGDEPAAAFPAPGLEGFVTNAVEILRSVNEGDAKRAGELLATFAHPLRVDRDSFAAKAATMLSTPAMQDYDMESIEFAGIKRLAGGVCYVYLVGYGPKGPVVFQFSAYRHSGVWYGDGYAFGPLFVGKNAPPNLDLDFTRFENPAVFPVERKPALTEAAKETAPR